MGTVVIKDGIKMAVRDGNQFAAFLNNGWTVASATEKPETPEKAKVEMPETARQYSKSEIQRMSTADLKAVAAEIGIEVTEESTGKALKEEIIAKLGL